MPMLGSLGTILAIVLVFSVLVFVHELGHFLFARRAGILAREFAIGFGPKLFAFKPGETLWTIRLLPLGGYVRMAGEEPETTELKEGQRVRLLTDEAGTVTRIYTDASTRPDEGFEVVVRRADFERGLTLVAEGPDGESLTFPVSPKAELISRGEALMIAPFDRQFGSKTLGQRFWVLFAGPLFNLLLAAVIFTALSLMNGVPKAEPEIGFVVPSSPAAEAGLKPGDIIRAVNGKPISSWEALQAIISQNGTVPMTVDIERDGREYRVEVAPKPVIYIEALTHTSQIELVPGDEVVAIDGTPLKSLNQAQALLEQARGKEVTLTVVRDQNRTIDVAYDLGKYALTLGETERIGVSQARDHSVIAAVINGPKETLLWIERIFAALGMLFTSHNPLNQVGGPVAIFKLTGDAAERGLSTLLFWTALLSVNLGIFNLLPIPALDGGRLLFLGIEAVRGRPIDQAKESLVHLIGFALLLFLILIVTWNDIQKLFLG
ncbi:MAG: RIP metalloprotease RseP [Hydrogenibacillus sp.]|nr:RIP metalloprotease RseP [Hydrogenibacillus sp.]